MRLLAPVTAALILSAAGLASAAPVRRLALVVGANQGAAGRVPLRYAVADAERFADLVSHIGGVAPSDRVVLRDPTRRALADALAAIGRGSARCARALLAAGGGHRLLLGSRGRPGADARPRDHALPRPAGRHPGAARGRAHHRARRVRVRRHHAAEGRPHPAGVPVRDARRRAGLRLPHLQLRDGGLAGIGAPGRLVLHPRTSCRRCGAPRT